jgi:hypothetical protein
MNVIEYPWPHIIIDNHFDSQLFQAMKAELINHVKVVKPKLNTLIKIEDFSYLPNTQKCVETSSINESTLQYFPDHRKYKTLTIRPQVLICVGQYQHRIHDEVESKVLSVVTYITSNKGHGTRLYDNDKNLIKEVEWKENRTLIFAGITGKTWHDYYSDPASIRITINFFLER